MKPEPVPTSVVCAACGLTWADHKLSRGKVTLSECVRLLKAELAKRPNYSVTMAGGSYFGNGSIQPATNVTNITKSA